VTPRTLDALRLGKWARWHNADAFRSEVPSFAGISGGATSGMMATLLSPETVLTFQNTGREHPRTLDFLHELDGALGGRIVWLEFRKPKVRASRPMHFEFAVVDYRTADRSGGPFEAFMEALAEYRATNGDPPIEPWARSRICTAYMKHKVADHYIESLGVKRCDRFIGLRYDEPTRIEDLMKQSTRARQFRCPLNLAEITKRDVREFWDAQPFKLGLLERQGNCTGCFLKDQSDLARVLGDAETDAEWWFKMEEKYPGFGGRSRPSYRQLASEREARLAIEAALVDHRAPVNAHGLDPRRFKLVVIQERNRLKGQILPFSCSCEGSMDLADRIDAADDAADYRDPWEAQLPLRGVA